MPALRARMTMQNPQKAFEVTIDNLRHGAEYATRAEADAAALAARTADPKKNVLVREIPPVR